MYFTPITQTQPLSYAYDRPEYYRNKAREDKWGVPVYFTPSTNKYDVGGQGGPYYKYGHNANEKLGKYGNCTWWVMGRNHEVNGVILTECIGDAYYFYSRYKGDKDGGSLTSGKYFGDTICAGDIIVFAESVSAPGDGHVIFVEKVEGNTLTVSESGYSTNASYKGNACVVYTLDKTKFKCGAKISLRPQSPYSEIAYGVIHTSMGRSKWEKPQPVAQDTSKDQLYIGEVNVNARDEATTDSPVMGTFSKPKAFFNVFSVVEKADYTWYNLGPDSWVAGCSSQIIYCPKEDTDDIKKLKEELKAVKAENTKLKAENTALTAEVDKLEENLDELQDNMARCKDLASQIINI